MRVSQVAIDQLVLIVAKQLSIPAPFDLNDEPNNVAIRPDRLTEQVRSLAFQPFDMRGREQLDLAIEHDVSAAKVRTQKSAQIG